MKFLLFLLVFTTLSTGIFSGCATATDPKWVALENQLNDLKMERGKVREKLTHNPTSPDAKALSIEISRLNRQVTATERLLSYSPTQPVTTEPVPIEYKGLVLTETLSTIKVSATAWYSLSVEERTQISKKISIAVLEKNMYGVIIETQTLDQSVAGSNAGSNLGSVLAQSSYIDNSFKNGSSYSATGQVGAAIVGAMLGSAFNRDAQPIFTTRYAVKLADGSIQTADGVSSLAFRLPLTMCVSFPNLDTNDQSLCTQTAETLKQRFLK